MPNRQAAQALLYKTIDQFMPGSPNLALYKKKFDAMSDADFDTFIQDLKVGKQRLVLVVPNGSKYRLDIAKNIEIAKSLGAQTFQQVWIPPTKGARKYLTPNPYMILYIPVRRQAQLLSKKISLAEDNKHTDAMTGQPTGASKAAQISWPELKTLAAMGMQDTLVELLKYRGGDEGGFRAMNTMLVRQGSVSMKDIQAYATGVKSTQALDKYLKACHLNSTLTK
jgi:hypothetical protein